MRGDSSVAGEGRVAGIPKFHSWGRSKYTMPLMNINSDWMSNASSGLYIIMSSKVTAPQDAHNFKQYRFSLAQPLLENQCELIL